MNLLRLSSDCQTAYWSVSSKEHEESVVSAVEVAATTVIVPFTTFDTVAAT